MCRRGGGEVVAEVARTSGIEMAIWDLMGTGSSRSKRKAASLMRSIQRWTAGMEAEATAAVAAAVEVGTSMTVVPSPSSLTTLPSVSLVKLMSMDDVLDASKEKLFASLVPDNSAKALSRYTEMVDDVIRTQAQGSELARVRLKEGQNGKVKIIGAIAGVLGIIVLAVFVYMFWRRMSRKQDERTRPQIELAEGRSEVELEELPLYGLEKLVIATNNFDTMNKLGQGGFGHVYKGTLEGGQQIAIKRLSRASYMSL